MTTIPLMYQIANYKQEENSYSSEEKLTRIELAKFKWLTRFLNFILKFLGAFTYKTNINVTTIRIPDKDSITDKFREVIYNFEKRSGKFPELLIIGFDSWHSLIQSERFWITTTEHLDTRKFMGIDIILHPYISGIIPLSEKIFRK